MTPIPKQAMVLAAGFGKRLQPLTLTTPKPLLPVSGTPLLQQVFDKLVKAGVEKIVINTHYLADQIHQFCQQYNQAEIIVSHEPEVLETGGGIENALTHFDHQPFFSVNADIWWHEDQDTLFEGLAAHWNDEQMDALLTLIPKDHALAYQGNGDYSLTATNQLVFCQGASAPFIYGGIQLLHPRFFANVTPGPQSIVPLYHQSQERGRLFGYQFSGMWCDIGTLTAYTSLNEYLTVP